jgi:predicted nucleic acid-binding Zn ribbon protein
MTYLYETLPTRAGEAVKRFEFKQGMNEAPLTKHPETGEPIRRVILGGWGVFMPKAGGSAKAGSCGPSGCC